MVHFNTILTDKNLVINFMSSSVSFSLRLYINSQHMKCFIQSKCPSKLQNTIHLNLNFEFEVWIHFEMDRKFMLITRVVLRGILPEFLEILFTLIEGLCSVTQESAYLYTNLRPSIFSSTWYAQLGIR